MLNSDIDSTKIATILYTGDVDFGKSKPRQKPCAEYFIKEYVLEAIENVKLGKEIKPTRTSKPVNIPEELQQELNTNKELSTSFNTFSLSKQREYAGYIAEAKRASTKTKRLEKIIPMIMNGVGLHDKYKNC